MMRLLQNLAISLGSLVVTFGICEVIARQYVSAPMMVNATIESKTPSTAAAQSIVSEDGSIARFIQFGGPHGSRLFPNMTASIHRHECSKLDVVLRSNSLGLRGPDIGAKQPDEYRILMLGDSITIGDYLDEELTIPAQLQGVLTAQSKKVTVLNGGIPGASASDEFYHYLELADAVKPDLVLVGMYLNDAQDSKRFYRHTLRFPFNYSRFLTWLVQRFQLVDTEKLFQLSNLSNIETSWKEKFRAGRALRSGNQLVSRDGFDFEIYNASNDFGLAWNPDSWVRLTEISRSFVEITKRNGSRLAMVLLPVQMQVFAKDEVLDTRPQESFKRMCGELSMPCFDLLPKLRATATQGMTAAQLFYDHCHYKREGNDIVAQAIGSWLSAEKLDQK